VTHPYSIFIWQLNRDTGGSWTEPLQAYKEYAIYVANLIHKDTKSVIKVVRYGLNITYLPDEKNSRENREVRSTTPTA
jgi:hypothetical protein